MADYWVELLQELTVWKIDIVDGTMLWVIILYLQTIDAWEHKGGREEGTKKNMGVRHEMSRWAVKNRESEDRRLYQYLLKDW